MITGSNVKAFQEQSKHKFIGLLLLFLHFYFRKPKKRILQWAHDNVDAHERRLIAKRCDLEAANRCDRRGCEDCGRNADRRSGSFAGMCPIHERMNRPHSLELVIVPMPKVSYPSPPFKKKKRQNERCLSMGNLCLVDNSIKRF